jgi:hypothetical protein
MIEAPALQQLKDIHLPHAIAMWRVAPGWTTLYIVTALLFVYGCYIGYQKRNERYAIRCAILKLNKLQSLTKDNPENINIAAEISILVRRTALYYFKRDKVAGLTGEDWLQFLNESGSTSQFSEACGKLLIDAPYQKNNHADLTPLFALTKNWLNAIAKLKRKEK